MKLLRIFLVAILVCVQFSNVFAQMSGGFEGSRQNIINLNQMIGLPTDALGKDAYIDVEGSPYLYSFFTKCFIEFNDGKMFIGPMVRFNVTNQKLHYQGANDVELVLQDGVIKRFSFFIPSGKDSINYIFGCGYPAISTNSIYTFYQEYNVGTASLLRFINKTVVERKTSANINPYKEFSEASTYYVYNARYKKIEKWRKGKEFLLEMLFDKQDVVNRFMNDNKLSSKSPEEAIKVIQFYNNLKAE